MSPTCVGVSKRISGSAEEQSSRIGPWSPTAGPPLNQAAVGAICLESIHGSLAAGHPPSPRRCRSPQAYDMVRGDHNCLMRRDPVLDKYRIKSNWRSRARARECMTGPSWVVERESADPSSLIALLLVCPAVACSGAAHATGRESPRLLLEAIRVVPAPYACGTRVLVAATFGDLLSLVKASPGELPA